jgi:hypothetical protein
MKIIDLIEEAKKRALQEMAKRELASRQPQASTQGNALAGVRTPTPTRVGYQPTALETIRKQSFEIEKLLNSNVP